MQQDYDNSKYDLGPLVIPLGLAIVDLLGLHQALVSRHFRVAGPDQRGRRPVGIKRVSSDNVITANTVSLLVTSTVRLFPA